MAVASTIDMQHIKDHYYASHETVNPTRIIPLGPEIDYALPHDRKGWARVSGKGHPKQ